MAGKMAKLLGIGYLFGGKDVGASRTARAVSESIRDVADSAREAERESTSLQRMGNVLSAMANIQLSHITDALGGLADAAGINATSTSLESFGAQFGVTFRNATAGLGEFAEHARAVRGEISSTAFSLQVDAGDMLHAVTGLARSGRDLRDYGVSVRGLGGSIQAGILGGEQLANVLTQLDVGYEIGAQRAGRLLDRVTALGEQFGVGADAARAMPTVLEGINPLLSQFPDMARNVEGITESIYRLAVASQRGLGGTFESNLQSAIQVFSELGDQRSQFTRLFTGMESEFPVLATELGIATGDIQGAFDILSQDPMRFAQSLHHLMNTVDGFRPARLIQALREMGPQFAFLITGGDQTAQALHDASGAITNVDGAFNRMARNASGSSRTFAEALELVNEGFQTQIHQLANSMGAGNNNRRVLQSQRRAYSNLFHTIENATLRDDIFGTLTRAMVGVSRYGLIHGLTPALDEATRRFPALNQAIHEYLPALSGLGSGFMEAAIQAGPMLLAMQQMGVFRGVGAVFNVMTSPLRMVAGLLGPVGLAAAAAAAAGALIYRNWDTLGPMFDRVHGALTDAANGLRDWVQSIDWSDLGRRMGDGLVSFVSGAFSMLREVLTTRAAPEGEIIKATIVQNVFGSIGEAFTEFVSSFAARIPTALQEIATGLQSIDWNSLGSRIGEGLRQAVSFAWSLVAGSMSSDGAANIITAGLGVAEALGGAVTDFLFGFIDGVFGTFLSDMGDGLWNDVIRPAFSDIGEIFGDLGDMFGLTSENVGALWDKFKGFARWVMTNFVRGVVTKVAMFRRNLVEAKYAIKDLKAAFEASSAIMTAGWREAGAAISEFFMVPITRAGQVVSNMWSDMKINVMRMRDAFYSLGDAILEGLVSALQHIPGMGDAVTGMLGGRVSIGLQRGRLGQDIQDEVTRQAADNMRMESEMVRLRGEAAASHRERVGLERALAAEVRANNVAMNAELQTIDRAISDAQRDVDGQSGQFDSNRPSTPREDTYEALPTGAPTPEAPSVPSSNADENGQRPSAARERAAERRRAQTEASDRRDERNHEMIISSFGREAMQQLASVLGPRTGPTGRPTRGPAGARPGTGIDRT